MNKLISICLAFFLIIACNNFVLAQANTENDSLTSDELFMKGKSFIEHAYPDVTIEDIAPHFPGDKHKLTSKSNYKQIKEDWLTRYPHENKLINYLYKKRAAETPITEEEARERREKEKLKNK